MSTTPRLSLFLFAALVSGAPTRSAAADWPQWRGPNRDGRSAETGLLKEWPAGGPRLVWKATGLGGGYGGPAVARGRIYLGGSVDGNDVVCALDASTGKPVWTAKVGPIPKETGPGQGIDANDGPRATPTVDRDRLYMLGAGGRLTGLETTTGKEAWHKELARDLGGRMMSGWGYSESVLVDGDRVVCTPGSPKGTVAALDRTSGNLLWQSSALTDAAAYSSIVIANLAGVRQYVLFTDRHVAGTSPADGRVLWQAPRPGETAVIPTPIVHGDEVFVTSGYGVGCNLFRVSKSANGLVATQVYANRDLANHHGGVVWAGDHLYGHSDGKGWVCLEWATGKVVWANRGVGKGSVAYADGHLYCRSEASAGTVALVEATPKGYIEKGRFDQPDRSALNSWPHPVIAHGRLYLRDQGILLCYDLVSR